MRRAFIISLVVLTFFFPMISTKGSIDNAPAGQKERAKIKGVVHDVYQGRIVDALVTFEASHSHYAVRTNGAGEFQIVVLPERYFITVNKEGFRPYISSEVTVKGGKTEKLNIALRENKPELLVPAGPVTQNLTK